MLSSSSSGTASVLYSSSAAVYVYVMRVLCIMFVEAMCESVQYVVNVVVLYFSMSMCVVYVCSSALCVV